VATTGKVMKNHIMENLKLVMEKWTFLESHGIFLKVAWKIKVNQDKKNLELWLGKSWRITHKTWRL
jgi:hypothetical protein